MNKFFFVIASVFIFGQASATSFDLEMTGPEYLRYLESSAFKMRPNRASAEVNQIISVGKRNLDWFKLINAQRPVDQQLALYTPELQSGIPIESPKAYNETTVVADYDALMLELPQNFKDTLLASSELPTAHPFADNNEEYLNWTRKMDRVYQSASRWKIMEPNLMFLADRSFKDIRGYYFLSQIANIEEQLADWATLSDEQKAQYTEWLVLVCHNGYFKKDFCRSTLAAHIVENKVADFYNEYLLNSQQMYDSFFELKNPRRDVLWNSSNPLLAVLPFLKPESFEVQKWLTDNIEDEWKWNDWQLKLDFTEEDNNSTFIVFTPGATPNVNGLGGNRITMDANAPMQDYGSRWTIRHEYGHVLGLPDCYIEFYDTDREIIINYQIDLSNLMCSRKGKLQEKHYLELKKHYYSAN